MNTNVHSLALAVVCWCLVGGAVATAPVQLLVPSGASANDRLVVAAAKEALAGANEIAVEPGTASLVRALSLALEGGRPVVFAAPTGTLTFDEKTRLAIVREVVPRALRSGSNLHVLAIGGDDVPLFARQLARLTGGTAATAATSAEAQEAVRAATVQPDVGRRLNRGEFSVDGDRAPVTLLARIAADASLRLESPLQQVIDVQTFSPGVAWFQEGDTALITLAAPTPGRWRVAGSRSADVYHGLRLELRNVKGPAADDATDTLSARLVDVVGDIDEPLLWELSRLRVWLQDAEAAQPLDVTPASAAVPRGYPTVRVPKEVPADAHVVAALHGRTFKLLARHPPDGTAAVNVALVPLEAGLIVARVKLLDSTVLEAGARVIATLQLATGRSKIVVASHDGDRVWHVELPSLDAALGATFKVKGQDLSGAPFEVETRAIRWQSPLATPLVQDFDGGGRPIGVVEDPLPSDAVATASVAADAAEEGDEAHLVADAEASTEPGSVEPASKTLLVSTSVGIALVANAMLVFALVLRARRVASVRTTRLTAAIDDYQQALNARGG